MLSSFRHLVKKNEADIVLVLGVILVALISFGAGRLTAPQAEKEMITIQEPLTAASIQQSLSPQTQNTEAEPREIKTESQETAQKGKFVGSIKSDKYHWPWSSSAKRIKLENQIWFESEAEAQKAGYQPASDFNKWAPADYMP